MHAVGTTAAEIAADDEHAQDRYEQDGLQCPSIKKHCKIHKQLLT
jgi:hypothetical protein